MTEAEQTNQPTTDGKDDERVEVSVIIPAYNEAERLPPTLEKVEEFLRQNCVSWEIIVADDGSTDGSMQTMPAEFPNIKFLIAEKNQGKGAAVRRGMLAAEGQYLLFTDADLSTPIEELAPMLEIAQRGVYEVVIASRGLPESELVIRQPWWRELSGKTFNWLVRPLSGLRIADTQCGFKLYTRKAARQIFSMNRCDGWAFDVETLILAQMLSYQIYEHPVRWINAEGSKVNLMKDAPKMFFDILRFRTWHFDGTYFRDEAEDSRAH